MNDETFHAVVQGVYAEELGDSLTAAAAIGDTVLHVRDVAHFDEEGGWLLLNDVLLEYESCDDDDSTITLTAALTIGAAVDDPVAVWDEANSQRAVVYKAVVDQIDGFDGVATAIVDHGQMTALAQTMRDGTGESVSLARDGSQLKLVGIHGRAFALAALQYLQGGFTTRQSEDEAGIDILGADSGTPGIYFYDATGLLISHLSNDDAGGVWKFYSENGDAAGYINPGLTLVDSADVPFVDIATSFADGFTAGQLRLRASSLGGDPPRLHVANGGDLFVDGQVDCWFITASGSIHSAANGIWMDDLAVGGSLTGASIGAAGRIQRTTSSKRYKDNIEPLPIEDARRVLALEPVTFQRKDEAEIPDRRTYPGFIAEQVAEAGAELWVNRDGEGRPDGVRYDEITAALIPIIREQQQQIDDLTTRLTALEKALGDRQKKGN